MDRILAGVLGLPIGVLIIFYRFQLKQFTGDMDFAEKYLGAGGTYTFFIILGALVFILSLMYALGTLQDFIGGTFGRLFA
jgi:hypothetical protein